MKNVDKDELLELLLSEDKEVKKLGVSVLINNFNLPERLYRIENRYGYYYTHICPKKKLFSSLNKEEYLNYLTNNLMNKKHKTILLSAIFKYNEKCG